MKHWIYEKILLLVAGLLLLIVLLWALIPSLQTTTFLYPALGSAFGLSYFVLKQHLEEVRLFKELFSSFNERFDRMNGPLFDILECPLEQELSNEEKKLLFDYFNLCAEEYLYYRKGFIYREVWQAWRNGMRVFSDCPRIRKLWEKELAANSYYGFKLPCGCSSQ